MNFEDNLVGHQLQNERVFGFQAGCCHYLNMESFNQKSHDDKGRDVEVRIFNDICRTVDKKLVKNTEIEFRGRTLLIKDIYDFRAQNSMGKLRRGSKGTHASSINASQANTVMIKHFQHKRRQIFKRKQTVATKKRNTKNVTKNFCRAFMCYLEGRGEQRNLMRLQELIEVHQFNNTIISTVVEQTGVSGSFKRFLLTQANEWIEISKIRDKEIHREAIPLYLELLDNCKSSSEQLANSSMSCFNQASIDEEPL